MKKGKKTYKGKATSAKPKYAAGQGKGGYGKSESKGGRGGTGGAGQKGNYKTR